PRHAGLFKAGTDRFKSVIAVAGAVERKLDCPVVRQIHGTPGDVTREMFRCSAAADTGLIQVHRVRPIVAEMKFPVRIQRQMLARRCPDRAGADEKQKINDRESRHSVCLNSEWATESRRTQRTKIEE